MKEFFYQRIPIQAFIFEFTTESAKKIQQFLFWDFDTTCIFLFL